MQFENNDAAPFEIPTEWWEAAGMPGFVRSAPHYDFNFDRNGKVVPVAEVAPPRRKPGCGGFSKDGFDEERMVSILRAFCAGKPLPPVEVTEVCINSALFRYRVYNGLHRYYASIAAAFSHLPVTVVPDVQSFLDREAAVGAKTERLKVVK